LRYFRVFSRFVSRESAFWGALLVICIKYTARGLAVDAIMGAQSGNSAETIWL
jgi:uncharacterized membrane protein